MARVILSEQTADRIRQLIERQYKPGDRIPAEMELAEFPGREGVLAVQKR